MISNLVLIFKFTNMSKKYKSDIITNYKSSTDVLNFGVNKNRQIKDIVINDSGYLYWCKNNIKKFKLSKEIITELNLDPETYKPN